MGAQIAAPNGIYYIVPNPNPKPGHEDWYGLIKADDRLDDYFDDKGVTRSGVRLHLGSISYGCVTVNKYGPNGPEKWDDIRSMLGRTSKGKLTIRNGPQFWNGSSETISYGTIEIK